MFISQKLTCKKGTVYLYWPVRELRFAISTAYRSAVQYYSTYSVIIPLIQYYTTSWVG